MGTQRVQHDSDFHFSLSWLLKETHLQVEAEVRLWIPESEIKTELFPEDLKRISVFYVDFQETLFCLPESFYLKKQQQSQLSA